MNQKHRWHSRGLSNACYAKDPAQRPTAAELVDGLSAASAPDAMLTPSQVGRRRWKRRGKYLAIAAIGAVPVIVVGVMIATQVTTFLVSGGEGADPALVASGAGVPDSIEQQARHAGALRANERIEFVFIQANRTVADAFFITDSAIVRVRPGGTIRRSLDASDVNLQPIKRGGSAGGLLIVTERGLAPDTMYQDLTGREGYRLMNEFSTWRRAQKARDSMPR